MKVLIIALMVFVLNIPFGYWRTNVKNLSLQWFMAVHVPVTFVIFFRIFADIGFEFYTYPVFIAAFFLGQFAGSRIYLHKKFNTNDPLSSCLVMDTYKKHKH